MGEKGHRGGLRNDVVGTKETEALIGWEVDDITESNHLFCGIRACLALNRYTIALGNRSPQFHKYTEGNSFMNQGI